MAGRSVLIALALCLGVIAPASAEPCRTQARCSEIASEGPALRLAVAKRARLQARPRLELELATAASDDDRTGDDKIEMPWIWKQLRRSAYRHLPRKRIDRFDATLAPTVVSTGFDTVAGAGVRGHF
ncbi:MAG: hypothetical protein KJO07_04435 [Deltaproteobacteria bacterium]|jgi:hypothetical protein|nr:hypothetical protein [Deltaproteobacteria bacterium]